MLRRFMTVEEDYITEVKHTNFSFGELYGLELIATYNPAKTMRVITTLNVYQQRIDPDEFGTANYAFNNGSYTVNVNASKRFKKGWSMQIAGDYRGKMIVLQGVILPRYGIDMGIRKSLWNRRASLSLNCRDLFDTRNFRFESANVPNFTHDLLREWQSQMFTASFSYKFGKTAKGPQRRRNQANGSGDDFSLPDMQ
jgi:hypothetical protein